MAIIFSKVLGPTDTESNLLIPTSCFGNNNLAIGEGDPVNVYDPKREKKWVIGCTAEAEAEVLVSRGWLEFARSKNLKPYDEVVFHKEMHGDKAMLNIQVSRKIRLFGQDICAKLPYPGDSLDVFTLCEVFKMDAFL